VPFIPGCEGRTRKKKRRASQEQASGQLDIAAGHLERLDDFISGEAHLHQLVDVCLRKQPRRRRRRLLRRLRRRRRLSVRLRLRRATRRLPRRPTVALKIRRRLRRRGGARLRDGAGPSADLGAGRALDSRLVQEKLLVLGDIRLAEEGNVDVADDERAFLQVDAGLVALEHVEAEEEVDVLALHDGEAAGEEEGADLDLGGVHAAQDGGGADAAGDAGEALVDEAHDAARFGARRGHDGRLGAGVDEGFDFVPVYFHVDVEHVYFAEGWGSGVSLVHFGVQRLLTFRVVLQSVL